MPQKPFDQLSEAYRKRLLSGMRRGKSRQQARGHKPKEHVIRAQKERKRAEQTGALTTPQRARVKKFVLAQGAKLSGFDPAEEWPVWKEFFEGRGYAYFLHIRETQQNLHRQFRRIGISGHVIGTAEQMEAFAQKEDVEGWLLYYH